MRPEKHMYVLRDNAGQKPKCGQVKKGITNNPGICRMPVAEIEKLILALRRKMVVLKAGDECINSYRTELLAGEPVQLADSIVYTQGGTV